MSEISKNLRKVAAGAACLVEREEAVIAVESRDHAKNNGVSPKNQISRGNFLLKIFLMLLCNFVFLTGFSQKKATIATQKEFAISKETPIGVSKGDKSIPDWGNIVLDIETELLLSGFNVVPYEVAINAKTKDFDINSNSNNTSGIIREYNRTYIPTSIVISVYLSVAGMSKYNYRIRIIDTSDNQLLAVFDYNVTNWSGFGNSNENKKAAKFFVKNLLKYLQK